MERLEVGDPDEMVRGEATLWQCIFGYVDGMALKCVVELGIPDIINSHGCPLSLFYIAKSINHPSLDTDRLSRVMTLLVHRGIFTSSSEGKHNATTLYGLTNSSKFLLRDSKRSLAPLLMLENHTWMIQPWHQLSDIIKEGGNGFSRSHGLELWDFASVNPEFNILFNGAMSGASNIMVEAMKTSYKDGLNGVGSLVDVGGGSGAMVGEIVKAHPHIKGINFDLPHVVAMAPQYEGVTHIAGDMFESIPAADVILMKWILHVWNDENCIKILKKCREALPKKIGKLIIMEAVLNPEEQDLFEHTKLMFDMLMMVEVQGKERSEAEWKRLLEEGGFGSYKIIKVPTLLSIIEAYP
ncbi:desmethylxanthohumol 6'-O-methyltransferase [Manihot esculenta]|uniref:O-methyltransferase domain-containing protein n=1 Tax=Manihot esculenta TaxID=3983 RepID=A0A2C9UX95_MANES|nr:desmethylxanthohumol 6'-O-methyltransferase [Manihot esculenta]XP_043817446.1 desmethylxanthohumol 6'-O-methyltransferase [Manihot esculenta]OAY36223.1 hypothetical protein MANES_11G005100v8 [Manihot esculenta]